jgi:hypothetical protein
MHGSLASMPRLPSTEKLRKLRKTIFALAVRSRNHEETMFVKDGLSRSAEALTLLNASRICTFQKLLVFLVCWKGRTQEPKLNRTKILHF